MNHLYQYIGSKHGYYVNGRSYGICIEQTWPLRRIKIYMPRGYDGGQVAGSQLKYKNMAEFHREWRKI